MARRHVLNKAVDTLIVQLIGGELFSRELVGMCENQACKMHVITVETTTYPFSYTG